MASTAAITLVLAGASSEMIALGASEHGVGAGLHIRTEDGYAWLGAIGFDDLGQPLFSNRTMDGEVLNPLLVQVGDELDALLTTLLDDELMPGWLVGCDCGLCGPCLRRASTHGAA